MYLEAFPGEEVDLLVALRGCVQGLTTKKIDQRSFGLKGINNNKREQQQQTRPKWAR